MAFCGFSETFALFDCTPVENLFIQEYMLRAPGEYVKVYLYGLMQCHHPSERMSVETMAKDLDMETEAVLRAFSYWEREGLVSCVSDNPRAYAYKNLKQVQLTQNDPTQDLYKYKEFNRALERLFDKKRKLYEQDYRRIYDWIELLGLPEEVVLQLMGYMIDSYKVRFSFDKADKIAQEWARSGVKTLADAEEMTRTSKAMRQGLSSVMRKLGMRRNPTQVEEDYYDKWVNRWSFSVEGILEACNETIKGTNPSFAYLDSILMRQWKQGNRSASDIESSRAREREQFARVRTVLAALGRYGAPTKEDADRVDGWLKQGFEHEVIVRAAALVHSKGSTNMELVDHRLAQWAQSGLYSGEALEAYLENIRQDNRALAPVFAACGLEHRPGNGDREMLARWRDEWKLPPDVWALAASYALGARAPMQVTDKILSSWHAQGIDTLDAARREHDARGARPEQNTVAKDKSGPAREVAAHRYVQREYSTEEEEALFDDFLATERGNEA